MSTWIPERLRPGLKRVAPHVLTKLPGTSARFGPPRKLVRSAAEWTAAWNERHHDAADAAEIRWVHDAPVMDRSASLGVQGLDWARLDMHLYEGMQRYAIGAHHQGVPTFAMAMPRGRVADIFGSVITPDDGLLAEASFGFVADESQHPIRRQTRLGPVVRVKGTAATVASGHAEAYFHWLFDVLPRLEILRLAGRDVDSVDHLVVNAAGAAYERETLDRFGVPADRVHIIGVGTQVLADRLIVASTSGVAGNVPVWVCHLLRQRLLSPEPPPERPLRVYVSRADTLQRRVADEDRLVALLEPLGFTCLTLSGRSVGEQVELFSRADIIVAPHGGGLANLVWCRPGTAVVELYAHDYVNPVFWGLSEALGLRHHHVVGRPATPGIRRGLGDMVIDPEVTVRAVELALEHAAGSARGPD